MRNSSVKSSYIKWDDDDVHFVLDQHAELGFYSANSLKQQTAGRYAGADPGGAPL
jgi:hypothetical protein